MDNRLTIIICTKNRFEEVCRCTKSILKQSLLPNELLVVDSTENKKLNFILKKTIKDKLKLTYINRPANLTQARNISLNYAQGKIVMFLDDDTILEKNYIKKILEVFHNYKGERPIGGVSGNIINGSQTWLKNLFNTVFFLFKYGNGQFRLSGIQSFVCKTANEIIRVECLSGANMSFKKDIIKRFKFDETSPHSEDDDIAYRVSRQCQNIYTPFAKLTHQEAPSGGGYGLRSERACKEIQGLYYHFKKNLPQTPKHKIAFNIALTGMFLNELINLISFKPEASKKLKGIIKGIQSIH